MSQPADEPTAREEITKRLDRIAGHGQSLKRMWEEGRQIDDMLTQVETPETQEET